MRTRNSSPLARRRSRLQSRHCLLLIAMLSSTGAHAVCSSNVPPNGANVVCTTAAPNPDPLGVQGAVGIADVDVTVNASAGVLTTNQPGVWSRGAGWTVGTAGTIAAELAGVGTNAIGVRLDNGGTLDVLATGSIGGVNGAVVVAGPAAITNAGTIGAEGGGILAGNADTTVVNSGTITGGSSTSRAIRLDAGGAVTNNAGAIIQTGFTGVELHAAGSVDNAGTIDGTNSGVRSSAGDVVVINRAGALISGIGVGLNLGTGNDEVTNAGEIRDSQPGGGSLTLGDGDDTLTLQTGSVLVGTADGGAGSNTLIAEGKGTEDNSFNEFQQVLGEGWTLTGILTAAAGTTFDIAAGGLAVSRIAGGPVVKNGPGALIVFGNSTYTGGTTINSGILQLGNGGVAGLVPGDVANSAILLFNRSNDVAFPGAISGTGGVGKLGPGVLTLPGVSTYTGPTAVDAGTLVVAGALGDTSVTVASAARLAGDGTIAGAIALESGGTVEPGAIDTVGTLDAGAMNWRNEGAIAFQLGADQAGSDLLALSAAFAKVGDGAPGAYLFRFFDGAGPPTLTTYTLITFATPSGFTVDDFGYTYSGALPGLAGTFELTPTALLFTVTSLPVELQSFRVD